MKRVLCLAGLWALYYSLLRLLKITCPIYFFTGIPCPTCGMTRAILCLAKLDFQGYTEHNPMSVPVIFSCFVLLSEIKGKTMRKIAVFLLCANFVFYVFTLIRTFYSL